MVPIHHTDNIKNSKQQKGRRKDIEQAFGAVQARCKVSRYEEYRWEKGNVIEHNHACIIIQNRLVRVNQAGSRTEDMEQQNGHLEI